LNPGSCSPKIEKALLSVGFTAFGWVDGVSLLRLSESLDSTLVQSYGLRESAGAVVVAFPYDPRPVSEPASPGSESTGQPHTLSIGAFASSNRYATMVRLLRAAGRILAAESGLSVKAFHVAVNSRLPEKRLAVMAGLGFIGRSSLVVTKAYGPACLIGVLLTPGKFHVETVQTELDVSGSGNIVGSGCGECRACVDACPTGAIRIGNGTVPGLDTSACIQFWATEPGTVPEKVSLAWGKTLYGCDLCTNACPFSTAAWLAPGYGKGPAELADELALPEERKPGRSIPSALLEDADDEALRVLFRNTALGMSWIHPDCLRRNARMARGII